MLTLSGLLPESRSEVASGNSGTDFEHLWCTGWPTTPNLGHVCRGFKQAWSNAY